MSDEAPLTRADLQGLIDSLNSRDVGSFTALDRENLGHMRASLEFLTTSSNRRLNDLEADKDVVRGLIGTERDRRIAEDGKLHTRVNNTRYVSVAVSAFAGFIGGLFRVPVEWIKGG